MDKIKEKLAYLNEMAEKYNLLNYKANGKYQWRLDGIYEQMEVLVNILDGVTNEFDECYEEDVAEYRKHEGC